jgi:hypothetical protein
VEITKLNLEVQDLKNRNLQLQGRLEFQARREKTLEEMVVYREDAAVKAEGGAAAGGGGKPGAGGGGAAGNEPA